MLQWSPRIEKPVDAYSRDRDYRLKQLRSGVDYGANDVEEDDRTIRYRGGGFRGRDEERDRGRSSQDRVRFRDEVGHEISEKPIPSSRYSGQQEIGSRRNSPYDDQVDSRSHGSDSRRANPYLTG